MSETLPVPEAQIPTYYGLPALKPPPWKWYVPAYLYVGGVAGGASVLAGVSLLDERLSPLGQRARWVAAVGIPAGTALLVMDMGRPSRFLNMLRVFRPTSVINMGSWLLAVCGTTSVAAVILPRPWSVPASAVSALSGAAVATYTGALLSNTAVPLWNRGRWMLPFTFAASSASATACLLLPFSEEPREQQVLERLLVGGTLGGLAAKQFLEAEIGPSHARKPLRSGWTGALWTGAKLLGAAAVVSAVAVPTRRGRLLAAALGTAAAIAERFAILEAGKRSARDPRAAFESRGQ